MSCSERDFATFREICLGRNSYHYGLGHLILQRCTSSCFALGNQRFKYGLEWKVLAEIQMQASLCYYYYSYSATLKITSQTPFGLSAILQCIIGRTLLTALIKLQWKGNKYMI